MMLECPRCGFSQPKDRYCAKCGLDMETFEARPTPLLVRVLQNPNLHLTLIGLCLLIVIGYIFYSQRELVGREVGSFLDGTPLTSRDAGERGTVREGVVAGSATAVENSSDELPASEAQAQSADTPSAPMPKEGASEAAPEVQKLELSYWEVPREVLSNLIATARKIGESNEARAYDWPATSKVSDAIQSGGKRMGNARSIGVQPGQQILIETPATASEAFQYVMFLEVTKIENSDVSFKWDSTLVLAPVESAAEAASTLPTMKQLTQTDFSGSDTLPPQGTFIIIIDPANRSPRTEDISSAGEGPWNIFRSSRFRDGKSDWVLLVHTK